MSARKETYTVEILRDVETGVALIEEWHNAKGQLDRADGPATITRHRDGSVAERFWSRDGKDIKTSRTKAVNNASITRYAKKLAALKARGLAPKALD